MKTKSEEFEEAMGRWDFLKRKLEKEADTFLARADGIPTFQEAVGGTEIVGMEKLVGQVIDILFSSSSK